MMAGVDLESLKAALDEDEAAAKASLIPSPWLVSKGDGSWGDDLILGPGGEDAANCGPLESAHIARHDPARVLREVAAKRAILAAYEAVLRDCHSAGAPARRPRLYGEHDGLRTALAHLAAVYEDTPPT